MPQLATTEPRETAPAHLTHEVANQATPLEGFNRFRSDQVLVEGLRREGAAWAEPLAHDVGEWAGRADVIRWGFEANENPPVLRTHDRFGNRVDEVDFHPAWHELMRFVISRGVHVLPWRERRAGAHTAKSVLSIICGQVEAGVGCPMEMTYAVIPTLRMQPELAAEWEPRFLSLDYDPRFLPAQEKTGALCGMGMTEKQGGSDVRANTTIARPFNGGGPGGEYEITGHKWFMSAPGCDAFLILAQAPGGLSCFLLPRFTPDGERNRLHFQRLKDKLGNRSNGSSEVEFARAWARLVGEEGRGVPTIIEMVNHTRLSAVVGSTSGIRAATAQAIHHCSCRSAFGRRLVDQPLMRNVLADLAIESEAATIAALRLARAYDEAAAGDERARGFKRLANAELKYWVCKRAVAHAAEALECLGGNGYVEESGMPRIYREQPLNAIWEGSSNVQCLDVLRAMAKEPGSMDLFLAELGEAFGADPRLDQAIARIGGELSDLETIESRARRVVELMAVALQGSLLVRFGDEAVADTFCASRLDGDWGRAFGTLSASTDFKRIIDRHAPEGSHA
jgi:putative acyl-CoA dehydrogenase